MRRHRTKSTGGIGSAILGGKAEVEIKNGKLIIKAVKPRRPRKQSTQAQEERMEKFQEAVHYAKAVIKDPKRRAAYKRKLKGHRNVFQAALAEYMSKK